MSKKTDLLQAMALEYLRSIEALDTARRFEVAEAERKYKELKDATACSFNKEYMALHNSFDICECDVPCCSDLPKKPRVFDRCNQAATTALINKETGKQRNYCTHCAENYMKTGNFVKEK